MKRFIHNKTGWIAQKEWMNYYRVYVGKDLQMVVINSILKEIVEDSLDRSEIPNSEWVKDTKKETIYRPTPTGRRRVKYDMIQFWGKPKNRDWEEWESKYFNDDCKTGTFFYTTGVGGVWKSHKEYNLS